MNKNGIISDEETSTGYYKHALKDKQTNKQKNIYSPSLSNFSMHDEMIRCTLPYKYI